MDNNLKQELRERFNPDGSLLRRQQLRMLELLEAVDLVCKKYDIPYWLSSGTLIGAVRHQGFIPWDDDLDIEMLREDYLRLMKVLPEELPDKFVLQTHETDPNYISNYAKVRDMNSYLEETNAYDRIWKYQGVYIDIFSLERIPFSYPSVMNRKSSCITHRIEHKHEGMSDEILVDDLLLPNFLIEKWVEFVLNRGYIQCNWCHHATDLTILVDYKILIQLAGIVRESKGIRFPTPFAAPAVYNLGD